MGVSEEAADRLGRWFADYDAAGAESFSARLMYATGELQVSWTDDLRRTSTRIAEVQRLLGAKLVRITGMATNGAERAVKSGRFNAKLMLPI